MLGNSQCPLEWLHANGVVELLERVLGEVLPVVEVREVVHELCARHASEGGGAGAVQVGVQQHYGARQRVYSVCDS